MGMRFLIDEDLGPLIGSTLGSMGHEVILVTEILAPGTPGKTAERLPSRARTRVIQWPKLCHS